VNMVHAFGNHDDLCRMAEDVVNHCIEQLMPRMRTLDICIQIEDDCDIYGYCLAVDKREFVIEIKEDLKAFEFIETLCHEMVHVKQYARGELAVNGKIEYKTHEEYENIWYEKEAYAKEKELAALYIKQVLGK